MVSNRACLGSRQDNGLATFAGSQLGFGFMRSSGTHQHLQALAEHAEWEWHFNQLADFIRAHGHSNLGPHPVSDWLLRQRYEARLERLSLSRQQRLQDLGIDLSEDCPFPPEEPDEDIASGESRRSSPRFKELWEARFAELCAYQKQHGHTNVTKTQNRVLGHWRDVQREFHRKGTLSAERIAMLEAIGFEWESPGRNGMSRDEWNQHLWDLQFERLAAFKERFGHCHVPVQWEEDRKLGEWVAFQRDQARRLRLPDNRRQRLDSLGFVWKPDSRFNLPPFPTTRAPAQNLINLWEQRFAELCAYQKQHGHANVTKGQNPVLGHWRDVQREFYHKGRLSAERIARLEAIGFEWESPGRDGMARDEWNRRRWEAQFIRLTAFKERHGHVQVSKDSKEDLSLANWVADQRKAHSQGRLCPDRIQRLEGLGFDWKPAARPSRKRRPGAVRESPARTALWQSRFAELAAFRQQHGHVRVPNKRPEVAKLCAWCYSQRDLCRKGALSPQRIAMLDSIGFEWANPSSPGRTYQEHLAQMWEDQFLRLKAFHQRFGHSRVPSTWSEDLRLVRWVEKQRLAFRKGRISPEHRARLDALGFVWKPDSSPVFRPRPDQRGPKPAHNATWLRHYEALREFHSLHGHFRPSKSAQGVLWRWCAAQRKAHGRGMLTDDRRTLLEAIGFLKSTPENSA